MGGSTLIDRVDDSVGDPVAAPVAVSEASSQDGGHAPELSPRRLRLVFLGLMLTLLLAALDQMIVATALPKIVGELHGLEKMSWAVTAYLLASTIGLPVGSRSTSDPPWSRSPPPVPPSAAQRVASPRPAAGSPRPCSCARTRTAAGRALPLTTQPATSCICTGWASRSSRLPGGQSSGARSTSSPLPQGKRDPAGFSRESASNISDLARSEELICLAVRAPAGTPAAPGGPAAAAAPCSAHGVLAARARLVPDRRDFRRSPVMRSAATASGPIPWAWTSVVQPHLLLRARTSHRLQLWRARRHYSACSGWVLFWGAVDVCSAVSGAV